MHWVVSALLGIIREIKLISAEKPQLFPYSSVNAVEIICRCFCGSLYTPSNEWHFVSHERLSCFITEAMFFCDRELFCLPSFHYGIHSFFGIWHQLRRKQRKNFADQRIQKNFSTSPWLLVEIHLLGFFSAFCNLVTRERPTDVFHAAIFSGVFAQRMLPVSIWTVAHCYVCNLFSIWCFWENSFNAQ